MDVEQDVGAEEWWYRTMEERATALGDGPFVFRLNDNNMGPSLLLQVISERGWRLYEPGGDDYWNVWWRSNAYHPCNHKNLGDWQFINHIPKGGLLCRKDNLSRILRVMKKAYGSIFDFSPPDFHLPLEYAKLVTECSKLRSRQSQTSKCMDREKEGTVWIYKPVAFSQGKGIFLFRNLNEIRCGGPAIVQRYIERPLLIAGYKFDLRLYAMVPCFRPLVVYLYGEGLARFSTDQYSLSDIHNPYRHLTNSSLNKHGPNYTECKNKIGNGCKWTLKQLRRQLSGSLGQRGSSAKEWLCWLRIRLIVVLTLLAHSTGTTSTRNCFELYGFDILLDEDLKPWLLEVNLSPALCADCEADLAVKAPMLHELFDLIGLPMKNTGLSTFAPPTKHSFDANPINNSCSSGRTSEDEVDWSNVSSSSKSTNVLKRKTSTSRLSPLQVRPVNLLPKSKVNVREKNGVVSVKTKMNSKLADDDSDEDPFEKPPLSHFNVKLKGTPVWGNGVYWSKAPGRVGDWVRVFPHKLDQSSEAVRMSVQVQSMCAMLRAGRIAAHSMAGAPDAVLEVALKEKFVVDKSFEMWLPPLGSATALGHK